MSSIKFSKNVSRLFVAFLFLVFHQNSYAIEPSVQLHKVDQSGAYGISFGIGDNFFNQQAYNWSVSYNRLQDINVTWNEDDINFSLDTIDLMLSYRYFPKTYNKFLKTLTFEFQAGLAVTLTENKFIWPDLNEEKYFSEQGDVNAVVQFSVHKSLTKEVSMQIGVKHYPNYSEFNDISSIFLGFSYRFGHKAGY
jgi:hypothetical protein